MLSVSSGDDGGAGGASGAAATGGPGESPGQIPPSDPWMRRRWRAESRSGRALASVLLLVGLFPTALLLYVVRQDLVHDRLIDDALRASSLRYRCLSVYALTESAANAAAQSGRSSPETASAVTLASETFHDMEAVHDELYQRYPQESLVMEPAWKDFETEMAATGRIRWETAEAMRRAGGALVSALTRRVDTDRRQEGIVLATGALGTLFSLLLSGGLLANLRRAEARTDELRASEEASLQRLRDERQFTDAVLQTAGAVVIVLDSAGLVIRFNRACEVLSGWSSADALANRRPFWEWLVPPDESAGVRDVFRRLRAGDFPLEYENDWFTRDGERRRIAWSNTALTSGTTGAVEFVIATGVDVTIARQYEAELRGANARLEELASTDPLTGLANRRTFDSRLAAEWERAVRYGLPLSLLQIDVDQFKNYNDQFGHPAGDLALRRVAQLLSTAARGSDLVARTGGEEFAVLLPHADRADAISTAERMRAVVAGASWDLRPITVSIGAATRGMGVPDLAALIANADVALYAAKSQRDSVRHARDMRLSGGE